MPRASAGLLLVLHRGAQDRVDARLISRVFPEMFEDIAIEPDADLLLWRWHHERRRREPVLIEFRRDIRVLPDRRSDFLVRDGIKFGPIRLAILRYACGLALQIVFFHAD